MRNIQLILAYDGTDFHGWQTQPGLRTVQHELEGIIGRVIRHPASLTASGRTDAGVHAAGQVANFFTPSVLPLEKLHPAIASRLPPDISLLRIRDVPPCFHSTQSAVSKLYRYRIHAGSGRPVQDQKHRYVYHYRRPLTIHLMEQAARYFVGSHDFRAFTPARGPAKDSYVRTIHRCDVDSILDEIRIDVQGSGFLYNQVRNMVGTLIEVGRGHWPPSQVQEILHSQDRRNAGSTAPPQGLCLQWVQYPPDVILERMDNPPARHKLP